MENYELSLSDDKRTVLSVDGTDIQHIRIPDGVTTIGEAAFSGCTLIESIGIPRPFAFATRRIEYKHL